MALVDVAMPKMGESITEGTVIAWHKGVGDAVELDETLLEIGTDKVDTDVPSPAAGTLAEILAEEGATVEVGTVIARIDTGGGASAAAAAPEAPVAATPPPAPAPTPVQEAVPAPSAPSTPAPAAPVAPATSAPAAPPSGGGARIEVVMPKMGESITEGTVIAWHKGVGDAVELDETLLEIGTDKVDTDVPSPAAGTLAEILAEEGATVEVGTVIAILTAGAPASTGASSTPDAPAAPAQTSAPAPAGGDVEASATAPVGMPYESSTEATVPMSVPRGAPEAAAYDPASTPSEPSGAPSAVAAAQAVADASPAPVDSGDGGPIGRTDAQGRFVSPLVRSIAEKEGLSMAELSSIGGQGGGGRVSKDDVLRYVEQRASGAASPAAVHAPAPAPAAPPAAAPAPAPAPVAAPAPRATAPAVVSGTPDGRVEIVQMDRMRRIIAEHMVRSKATSPHVTSFAEIDVTGVVRSRESNKAAFEKEHGVKLTYTPYFVHAAVEALRTHPLMNASVEGDTILVRKDIHVGIAVALGTSGLMAPVIRNAGDKNLVGLARATADLAARTRSKQLQPDELQGGTFTVTNIGSLGSLMGTPIINQPQVAILATGAIKKRVVVLEDEVNGDTMAIRSMMYVSLSYDHRIIDGAMASSYLSAYVRALERVDGSATV